MVFQRSSLARVGCTVKTAEGQQTLAPKPADECFQWQGDLSDIHVRQGLSNPRLRSNPVVSVRSIQSSGPNRDLLKLSTIAIHAAVNENLVRALPILSRFGDGAHPLKLQEIIVFRFTPRAGSSALWVHSVTPVLPKNQTWSGCRDSNSGPLDPQSSALPGCATSRPTSMISVQGSRMQIAAVRLDIGEPRSRA